jgi:hypothetical protein
MDNWGIGVLFPAATEIFLFPKRPFRFWGPPRLLFNGYRGLSGGGGGGGKATNQTNREKK